MAKDNGKTSKTARVMNLLSKKQDTAPAAEEATAPAAPAAPAAGAAPVPPIISSLTNDAAVSNQIKDALENALAGELEGAQPAAPEVPAAEPVQTAAPAPEPAPEPEPVQAPAEPAPAPAAAAPEPVPVAEPVRVTIPPVQPEIPAVTETVHKRPGYINVMRVLVEEKAPKYVHMFGLCDCQRCLEDVEALALNHLPPKYVVMSDRDRIPKITFYEGQYNSDITAQLLQACKVVMERPHHERKD